MAGRLRIGKLSWRELGWRVVLSLCLVVLIPAGWYDVHHSGSMLAGFVEMFLLGLGFLAFLFIVFIFRYLKDVLEYDEEFLYVIKIRYFKRLVDKCIAIKAISEIVFAGRQKACVTIKYEDKQCRIKCRKDDDVYKFLLWLGQKLNVLQQNEQTARHVVLNWLFKLIILGGGMTYLWMYGKDVYGLIMALGFLIVQFWFAFAGFVVFVILCSFLTGFRRRSQKGNL